MKRHTAAAALLGGLGFLLLTSLSAFGQSVIRMPPPGAPPGQGYPIKVESTVQGAAVYINNQYVGATPLIVTLVPGGYTVRVSSPGYGDYTQTINVSGVMTIIAPLRQQQISYNLSIVSNVNGAQVIVNGQASGQTPLTLAAQPGVYNIQVNASGYQPYSTQVQVNQDTTVNAQLQANFATLRIVMPGGFYNPDWNRARADSDIGVWIDGRRVGRGDIQVAAGNHTLRFGSGGWSVQGTYYFNPGQLYVVSPQLSITINPSN